MGPRFWRQGGGADEGLKRREARWFAGVGAAWLIAGVAFAVATGQDNRKELQENRLRGIAGQARTFDTAILEGVLGEELAWRRGPEPGVWQAESLAGERATRVRRELAAMVRRTPFLDEARIVVVHDGWVAVALSSRPPLVAGEVALLRAATEEDERRWAAGVPYVEQAEVAEMGARYAVRAPLRNGAGEMVGWLDFEREEFFQSLARKWRAGPLLVTALGLVAGALGWLQRRVGREREEERRERAVAEETNRRQMLFLAKVSHELRTPLQSVLGYGELLARDARDGVTRARVGAIREHGGMMLRLVNDLLDLAALRHGGFQLRWGVVEPGRLVREASEVLRGAAEAKGLRLDVAVADDAPEWIEADGTRLRQVVYNLVGNAVKFSEPGGAVRVGLRAEGGRLRLEVRDAGPGIAAEARAELFRPFARLEATAQLEGSGLGLALVAALVEAMGGTIAETGVEGEGACFVVEWPVVEVAAGEEDGRKVDAGGGGKATGLPGRRVLVVDDNALVRELFVGVLVEEGAVVEAVGSGATALARVAAGAVEVVVLDVGLPGMSGWDVARALRGMAGGVGLRIVGVSAEAGAASEARAKAAGMDVFLAKPVELGRLVKAVGGGGRDGVSAHGTHGIHGRGEGNAGVKAERQGRVERMLRGELPEQMGALRKAVGAGDWSEVGRLAHYLRNSAMVVRDRDLGAACRALEEAAEKKNAASAEAAWETAERAARQWMEG